MPETRMNLDHLDWPFFDDRASRARRRISACWAAARVVGAGTRRRRRRLPRSRARARRRRLAALLRSRVPRRRAARARLARAVHRARDARLRTTVSPISRSRCRASAAARSRSPASPAQKARWLPRVAKGEAIAAFALSEPDAGSDVAAMTTQRRRDGDAWVLDGTQDVDLQRRHRRFLLRVRAHRRNGRARAASRRSSFRRDAPGLSIAERIEVIAPHPLARLEFDGCRVPADALLGAEGEGFKLAMRTLDIFRASVAAAALGFARRALDEALRTPRRARCSATTLADLQLTQAKLGEMATAIDAAALLTYRAAWLRDVHGAPGDARGGDGQDGRDRIGAAGDRRGGAAFRRPRRHARRGRRAPLPRDPRAAHLRRRDRSAEADHRARARQCVRREHADDRDPPTSTPSRATTCRRATSGRSSSSTCRSSSSRRGSTARPSCSTARSNAAGAIARRSSRPAACAGPIAELLAQANRIAHVLVEDLGLVPGNRVLLRAPNNPMLAACWFAVLKAGGIAVGTMPLLRAKELTDIVTKAEITHALCDARLADELDAARPACPTLTTVVLFGGTGASDGSRRGWRASRRRSPTSTPRPTTPALIAFTSGTTGKPKGTMHFHRDVIARVRLLARARRCARRPTTSSPAARRSRSRSGWAACCCFRCASAPRRCCSSSPAPDALLAAIAQHRATVLFTAPTSYRAMAAQASAARPVESLRKCVSAGEALPGGDARSCGRRRPASRSSTASARPRCCTSSSRTTRRTRSPAPPARPSPGYRACVMDDAGKPLPPGQVGRLAVKGPTGCRYLADDRQQQLRAGRLELHRRRLPRRRRRLLLLPGAHRRHDHHRRLQHRRARRSKARCCCIPRWPSAA